jgi:hypothetical protein
VVDDDDDDDDYQVPAGDGRGRKKKRSTRGTPKSGPRPEEKKGGESQAAPSPNEAAKREP